MKHVLVFDPASFSSQRWKMDQILDTVGAHFSKLGGRLGQVEFSTVISRHPRETIGIIQRQVDEILADENQTDPTVRVYAIGGGSMVSDCINGIAELPNIEFASVPYGARNVFVRSFGEGKEEAFRDIIALSSAPVIPTDLIKVDNTYAILGCGVGYPPAVAFKTQERNKRTDRRQLGRLAAAFWGLYTRLSLFFDKGVFARHYNVMIDGEDYSGVYSYIHVVNVPCFGHKKKGLATASPDDGVVDVVLFKSVTVLPMLISILRYSRGKLPSNCLRVAATKTVEISSSEPMYIQKDTEFLMDTKMNVEVIPNGVQVVTVDNLKYQKY